jgi:peptidyl-prolyl cis-trans isomerase SurA
MAFGITFQEVSNSPMPRWSILLVVSLSLTIGIVACGGGRFSSEKHAAETQARSDPIVAEYVDSSLALSEFERAYAEKHRDTSSSTDDSLAAYKNFLERYVNFRLKVRAARDAGMDTLSSIKQEVASYRESVGRPILMRSEVYEPLIRTLYERRKKEVDVSHILISVPSDAAPKDTIDAYREIKSISDSLERGVSFSQLAYRHSDGPSAQEKGERGYRGRLGYIRAGELPTAFEDRMYSVDPGTVSDVFRTRYGYHVLKVHDRRPATPPVRLSHIMIRRTTDSAKAVRTLDSLRTEIIDNQASFGRLARTYSEDGQTAPDGGDLGTVNARRSLPPSFREALPRLDSVGDVSDVVETRFGYHLVQLTDRESLPSFQEAYDELKETISGTPVVERRKAQFARRIRSNVKTSVDTSRLLRVAGASSLDSLSRDLLPTADRGPSSAGPIPTLGDSTFTVRQLAQHVLKTDGGARQSIGDVLESFLDEKALQYATARLKERDPSFARQMRTYREGLLAYRFMQDSVWSVAANDTEGLRRTFRKRRDQYRYPERVRTLTFRAPSDSVLFPYREMVTRDSTLAALATRAANDSLVTMDTVMVTDQSRGVYRRALSVDNGDGVGPLNDDGPLYLVRDRLLSARPKSFQEARSSILRDYRRQYEDTVIDRLRRRYDVTTYPGRLRRAFIDSTRAGGS